MTDILEAVPATPAHHETSASQPEPQLPEPERPRPPQDQAVGGGGSVSGRAGGAGERITELEPEGDGSADETGDDGPDDDDDDETTHRVSTYLVSAAVKAARRTNLSRGAVAIRAVDAALEAGVLAELVEARQKDAPDHNSRFPARKVSRRAPKRAHGLSSRVLWQPALSNTELDVLDEIMNEVGAVTRSELISVAIEWHVLPKEARATTEPDHEKPVNLDGLKW